MVFSLQILGRLQVRAHGYGLVAVVVGIAALATLAGCGQKGPLFMPILPPVPANMLVNPSGVDATAASPALPAASAPVP